MLGPHEVLSSETALLIEHLQARSYLTSDHHTNNINLEGRLPEDRSRLPEQIRSGLKRSESDFRPFFIGDA